MSDIYDDKLQTAIKNAESFLKSTMTSPIGYPAQEALIYLISRGNNCDDAIQEVRARWNTDEKTHPFGDTYRFWAHYDQGVIFYDTSMLRTAEWCNIGGYEKTWRNLYKNTEHYHSEYKELNYCPYFPYFRSRNFLKNMKKQLELTLDGYEKYFINRDWKNTSLEDVDRYEYGSQYFCNTLLSAAYIFGTYQIQSQIFDPDFRAEAIEYLFKSQLANGSWWNDKSDEKTVGVYQASIAIHALSIAKPDGYEHCIKMAKKWLLTQQHTDGYWKDYFVPCEIFLTVLVLDALELADGGDKLTFTPYFKMDKLASNVDLPVNAGVGNITINAGGTVYVQKNGDDNENTSHNGLSAAEDIKKKLKTAAHDLLTDEINQAIVIEYQNYEIKMESNPNIKRPPSFRKLAEILDSKGLGKKKLSPQGVKNRVDKLVKEGLLNDYFAEKRQAIRECPQDPNSFDERYVK